MKLAERIRAFSKLGGLLKECLYEKTGHLISPTTPPEKYFSDQSLIKAAKEASLENPWFIPAFIHYALKEASMILEKNNLVQWTGNYPDEMFHERRPLIIGNIMAGNVPLVGLHDFISVLLSGHIFKGKMSGKDDKLMPWLADRLVEIEPRFKELIRLGESKLGQTDAVIATGSNNTSRYFEYYFGKHPHIFRKNRNGVAILNGSETKAELSSLADDIFLYFGLGCRNISKVFVPENYKFDALFRELEKYRHMIEHHKYANNYQYNSTVLLINQVKHLDNGFFIIREEPSLSSPVGTLHVEIYHDPEQLSGLLKSQSADIQCIAGKDVPDIPTIGFGLSQQPKLWDYADNVDTLIFLHNLYEN